MQERLALSKTQLSTQASSAIVHSPLPEGRETARRRSPSSQFPLANQQWQLRCSARFPWQKKHCPLLLSEGLHPRLYSRGLRLSRLLRIVHGSGGRSYWNKFRQPNLSSRFRSTAPLAIHIAQRRGRCSEEGLWGQEVTRSICRPCQFCGRQERNHQTHLLIPDPGHSACRRGLKRPEVLELAYLSFSRRSNEYSACR